ncbi:MAG TPA: hypothetical protein VG488_01010 [Candidatus Angelobacter sp.]|jgi:hypothetical protein|nr:hypothetical protein [Candidatus Angelobacter sp.]
MDESNRVYWWDDSTNSPCRATWVAGDWKLEVKPYGCPAWLHVKRPTADLLAGLHELLDAAPICAS